MFDALNYSEDSSDSIVLKNITDITDSDDESINDDGWGSIDGNPSDSSHDLSDGEIMSYKTLSSLVQKNASADVINDIESSLGEYKNIKNNTRNKKDKNKQLLCKNMLQYGHCNYGSICKFAHSINEQVLEDIYERAYDMVQRDADLSKINVYVERDLYKILLKLCDVCKDCEKKKCPGGYNCKNGACKKIYVVCKTDLQNGNCDGKCGKIHLTKKGLKPFLSYVLEKQKKRSVRRQDKSIMGILLTSRFFEKDNIDTYEPDTMDGLGNITFDTSIFNVSV
jgi:hypothetical protein